MHVIGLTGGIGSGKTTIAKGLEKLGVPVYYSDDKAKYLMNTSVEIHDRLVEEFGKDSFVNNELNRSYIADIVFRNKEKLQILNSIVHPILANDFELWKHEKKSAKIVVREAAILFESGADKSCDYTVSISVDVEERISRVMHRDNTVESKVVDRINNQWSDEQRNKKADFVLYGSADTNSSNLISVLVDKLKKEFDISIVS
ncbi:MAG: dephospho-CoA kinase [Ichthyobacteriaceae bacterium]|nr:dephospho-CoA kinase [Ichthyobacteriaceae bacterium]